MTMRWFEKWAASHHSMRKAVAYYRYSAENRQENSIAIQRERVRAYAKRHNIEIVDEFIDEGKSGMTAEGRDGFLRLLKRVEIDQSFDLILILDHSRWGRFQDPDEAAAYQSHCKKHGKQVHFTINDRPVPPQGEHNIADKVMDTMGHAMASDYLVILSQKVLDGEKYVARLGNRCGGKAPFGTLRMEFDDRKQPLDIMRGTARKRYPNGRVRLTIGDKEEVDVVQNIFKWFTEKDMSEKQIAERLNKDGVPSPGKIAWSERAVRTILENEQYAGSVVYNKMSSKLTAGNIGNGKKPKTVRNPKEEWIIVPGSYPEVVPMAMFQRAREKIAMRSYVPSSEELILQATKFHKKYGMVPSTVLKYFPGAPQPDYLRKRFGSISEAYQAVFTTTIENVKENIVQILGDVVDLAEPYEDFIVLDEFITIKIVPAVPIPKGYGYEWYFRLDTRDIIDITLGVALSDVRSPTILGYFPLPRLMMTEGEFRVNDQSCIKIEMFGFHDLEFLRGIVRGPV